MNAEHVHIVKYGDRNVLLCRNGCDVSGIYTCIDHIVKKIESEKKVDVFNAVKAVRRTRPEFITSLVTILCYYLNSGLWEAIGALNI